MKKHLILFLEISILTFLAIETEAFDGDRKGFVLGAGLGGGLSSFTAKGIIDQNDPQPHIEKAHGVRTFILDLVKIGYAPSVQLEIYFCFKLAPELEGALFSFPCLAINYYLRPTSPGFYLSAGVGQAQLVGLRATRGLFGGGPESERDWSRTAFGFFGGAGYEFIRHLAMEFNLIIAPPNNDDSFEATAGRVVLVATAF